MLLSLGPIRPYKFGLSGTNGTKSGPIAPFPSPHPNLLTPSPTPAGPRSELEYDEGSREIARGYLSDCGGMSGSYDPAYIQAIKRHQLSHRAWVEANRSSWLGLAFSCGTCFVIGPLRSLGATYVSHVR